MGVEWVEERGEGKGGGEWMGTVRGRVGRRRGEASQWGER